MPDASLILAFVMMVALTLYALMGGADYGGGVWDLLATGERKAAQREVIANAIAPIWEANHVWLILVIVILFSAFPPAFAALSTSLHIPLTLLLLGIIARGSAFTFRKYDSSKDAVQARWGRIFSVSSTITPLLLGIIVGALSLGKISEKIEGLTFQQVYIDSWLNPFCLSVGGFALVLFSFLAAVYLTFVANTDELKSDFRFRAICAQFACATLALLVFFLADREVPDLHEALTHSPWSIGLQIITAICALTSTIGLLTRHYPIARIFAASQVTLILWGWGLSHFPYLIR
ncbi:MAG: cytochrome d ubiquinol oxidase subunit II, partial [Leptolyngbya sp.]|nr:cytochrome d ubiquinol oxidase subunit II [Candidatus Melainabacteria bacterium]